MHENLFSRDRAKSTVTLAKKKHIPNVYKHKESSSKSAFTLKVQSRLTNLFPVTTLPKNDSKTLRHKSFNIWIGYLVRVRPFSFLKLFVCDLTDGGRTGRLTGLKNRGPDLCILYKHRSGSLGTYNIRRRPSWMSAINISFVRLKVVSLSRLSSRFLDLPIHGSSHRQISQVIRL